MMGMSSGTAWSGQVKGLTGLQAVQVKKKMTVDEFVRNNRGINGGEDLPREFLRALYVSIAADEIRISSEAQARLSASGSLAAVVAVIYFISACKRFERY